MGVATHIESAAEQATPIHCRRSSPVLCRRSSPAGPLLPLLAGDQDPHGCSRPPSQEAAVGGVQVEAAFGGREVKAAWDDQNRPKKGAWARVGLLDCEGRALGCWRDPSPDRLCAPENIRCKLLSSMSTLGP